MSIQQQTESNRLQGHEIRSSTAHWMMSGVMMRFHDRLLAQLQKHHDMKLVDAHIVNTRAGGSCQVSNIVAHVTAITVKLLRC